MPIASGPAPHAYIGMATQPLEAMRPVLAAFWDAYARTRGFDEAKGRQELTRCMRFAAARLTWSAIEQRLYVSQLDPAATALLQVSLNILKDPPGRFRTFSMGKRSRATATAAGAAGRLAAALGSIDIRSPVEFSFAGEKPIDVAACRRRRRGAARRRLSKACSRGESRGPSTNAATPSARPQGRAAHRTRRSRRAQGGQHGPRAMGPGLDDPAVRAERAGFRAQRRP